MRPELEDIKQIRVDTNDLWMAILDVALRCAPNETKKIIASIRRNDMKISGKMEDILNEDR